MTTSVAATTKVPTIGLRFMKSVGVHGSYAITNEVDVGNKVYYFLSDLERRGAFNGRVSAGEWHSHNWIMGERHDRFVAHAKAQGFEVKRVFEIG